MPIAIRYTFDQSFSIPAAKAFQWCTDYGMDDHKIMGEINAKRQVVHLTESTILLKDTFQFGKTKVEKKKLVELYPQNLFWTSTHLSGPNKHSQFLYQIKPEDEANSTFTFTGLHLDYDEKANAKMLAEKLCKEDANAWKLLAKAMEKDLKT